MTDEVAEQNNVVAAACCRWCDHYDVDGQKCNESFCGKLQTLTWATDVCKHFKQSGVSDFPIMKKDNKTEKEDKYVVSVTVSIPNDMFEKLKNKAKEDFRDLNMEILYAIDKMLNDNVVINYCPSVWLNKPGKWYEDWDKNTTPIRPVNFPDTDPNKNWDGSPKITCSNA